MSITFRCPGCGHRLGARDDQVGKTFKCPDCGQLICVPAVSDPAHPLWPSAPADLSLPQQFLMLDAVRRKEALDLAWGDGPANVPMPPEPSPPGSSWVFIFGIVLLVLGALTCIVATPCLTALLEAVHVQDSEYVNTIQPEKQTQQEQQRASRDRLIYLICGEVFGLLMVCAGIVYIIRGVGQAAERRAIFQRSTTMRAYLSTCAYRRQLQAYVLGLQGLGVTFVRENYEAWRDGMSSLGEAKARQKAAVSQEFASFTVFSTDTAIPTSGMPEPSLQVMYIFSNGFISLVSNVKLNTKATSYSLVDRDQPSWYVDTDHADLDEFHYRDIVEVQYKARPPAPSVSVSPGVLAPPVSADPSAMAVRKADGDLCITLVSGTRKTYPSANPSTTHSLLSFMSTAREKMREAKKNH